MKTVVAALIDELTELATKVDKVHKILPAGTTARDTLSDLYQHLLDKTHDLREDLDEL